MQEYNTPEFLRDRALPFFAEASYSDLAAVLPMPKCGTRRQENILAGIVAGMAHHCRMHPSDQFISYSRDHSVYPGQEIYYGADWGYGPVVSSIDKLDNNGWFIEHDRKKQQHKAIGQQSRFIPNSEKFKAVTLPKMQKSVGELIRLRDRKDKVLIPYRETEAVARMRKFVAKVNVHLRNADIQFTGGVRRNGSIVYFESIDEQDGRLKTSAVDMDDIELYRVFSDVWSLGGRYYGGAWQNVPKGERKHFILDGETVREHDYKNNHPSILYMAEGKPLDLDSDYDAYDIAGFKDQRLACKRTLNIMLNARDYGSAVGAVREHVTSHTYEEAKELVEAVKLKHEAIGKYFFSDVGLKLQRLDAEMCGAVLNEMTIKRSVTCMPLHDSFMVPASAADELVRVMSSVFNKHTSNVTNSSFGSKTSGKNILNTGAFRRVALSVGGLPCSVAEDSESESRRNRKKIQNRNPKTAGTNGKKNVRWERLKRKTVTAQTTDTTTTLSVTKRENAPEKAVAFTRDAKVSVDMGNAAESTVHPISDGSTRKPSPFVDALVKVEVEFEKEDERREELKRRFGHSSFLGRGFAKTTTADLIREEEKRRDAKRNGKKLKTGRE
ncbi:hypothetical protein [Agrobacterium pusense]|uniref:hypothetical protein n=1 Tax=Agrobacterium pusense TaxID=648995 RepID=UPI002F3EBD4C